MRRIAVLFALLAASAALAQPPPLALDAVHVDAAYGDHPLVQTVRAQGYLAILDREKVLDARFPTDRAWAVLDAVGAAGVARHAVDSFVTQGLLARLAIGPSGALQAQDIGVAQLNARQAFVLGWLRALALGGDSKRLLRRSAKVSDAGALQLLERAEQQAPDNQTIRLAHALIAAAADVQPRHACDHAVQLATLARDPGSESVRLAVAERIDALAHTLGAACTNRELAALSAPIQLPPPAAEIVQGQRAPFQDRFVSAPHASTPFVVTAPVFKGWLRDTVVARIAGGARLEVASLLDALQRDATGDLAIAVLNAASLVGRMTPDQVGAVAWQAVASRHGVTRDAEKAQLGMTTLTPQELTVYGYAQALRPQVVGAPDDVGDARTLTPAALFSAAKGKLPSAATLGPLMALAHAIDREREPDPCRPHEAEDALRGVVQRATLPDAGRQPLLQALDTLLGQCKTARP